ncbi:putative bifunctional diguanylate cyclase/phosphodiesterase [Deinococcus koreensis]|uniref:GGDEF-domain containing protein n=1 Tax=Deinococcus koreensis TaxID=2054903 RepID=A0A2K3UZH5_9DEIO|nr:EAL domain-containing protein [Deinococcus koreensis]PNY81948.1 hypothetical protein CVO96_11745 [Deinococcus koreensis]
MSPPTALRPSRADVPALLGLLGLYALHLALLLLPETGLGLPRLLGALPAGLTYVPVVLGAGALILSLAPRTPVPRAWRLIGTGTLLWGLGQLLYVAAQDTSGSATLADPLFLAFPVFFLLAFGQFERRWPTVTGAARLDVAALVVCLGAYLWYVLLAAQLSNPAHDPLSNLVAASYPLSDLLLLNLLIAQAWRRPGTAPHGQWWLALGMVGFIAADLGFSLLTLRGQYSGTQWPDALWPLSALVFAFAAYRATAVEAREEARPPGSAPRHPAATHPAARRSIGPLSRLTPYAALLGSFGLTLSLHSLHTPAARGVLIANAVVALLVAARQTQALRDLEKRSAELEDSRVLLQHQAFHDPLTGLGNRAQLRATLSRMLEEGELDEPRPVGLLFVDLDNFKFVNDALGHRAGDELLQEVARRLVAVGGPGVHCVRLGGDEFVLVQTGGGERSLSDMSDRIGEALRVPIELAGQHLHITASLGGALSTPQMRDPATLLRWADQALYTVKRSGKNAMSLHRPGIHDDEAARRVLIETRLRGAHERRELTLHYQPQLDRDGQQRSFEALLRWHDAELGPVSPAEFVPIAETAGLVTALDNWVVDQACWQLAQWFPAHPERRVSVNVSPPHLVRAGFLETLRTALERHGVPATALEIEVTERLLIEQEAQARTTLRALLDLGVQVAIDDFGVGQSSLAALLKLPISVLKIDRAFVGELEGPDAAQSQAASQVVQAVVALGRALGLRVVAEGVESCAQAQLLWGLGVDALQGYWIGRPVAPGEVAPVSAAARSTLPPATPPGSTLPTSPLPRHAPNPGEAGVLG